MKTRRVTEHLECNGRDILQVVVIWEPGMNKESIKQQVPYRKKHQVLINGGDVYRFK